MGTEAIGYSLRALERPALFLPNEGHQHSEQRARGMDGVLAVIILTSERLARDDDDNHLLEIKWATRALVTNELLRLPCNYDTSYSLRDREERLRDQMSIPN